MERQAGQAPAARTLNAQHSKNRRPESRPSEKRLALFPPSRDLVGECAETLLARFADSLPDLRRAVVLMPNPLQQRRLRRLLLEQAQARGHEALLPPTTGTFRTLFRERLPDRAAILSEHERKLLLVSALDKHPGLLPHTEYQAGRRAGQWEWAAQLLQLFDEIAATRTDDKPLHEPLSGFSGDFVQTLYNAWREDRAQTPDVHTLYLAGLRDDALTRDDEHVFLCGFNELSPCETAWAARMYRKGRLTLIAHAAAARYPSPVLELAEAISGEPPPPADADDNRADDARARLIDAAYASEGDVAERARSVKHGDDSLSGKVSVFKPESLEEHAFGVYLQVRDWLEAGIAPVTVASHDRKLLRRLRAVFEHNDIALCDHAGWALSTTASAAAVATLLPPAEQGFGADAVLALARSPYCRYGLDVMRVQKICAYLERAIAKVEPFGDLDEIVAALQARRPGGEQDAKDSTRDFTRDFRQIITRIHEALDGLRDAMNASRPLNTLFDALFAALDALGMKDGLRKDEAGARVIEVLEEMAAAAQTQSDDQGNDQGGGAHWSLWRRWILHVLERENFTPRKHDYLIEICNLSQAALARPAGLVIAALDTDHALPPETLPLLDEDTRRAFGLPGHKQCVAAEFTRFRAALESAEHVLLTCRRADRGATLTPAPWLDGLQHFHSLACGDDLEDCDMRRRAQAEARASGDPFEDPPARPQMPAPTLPEWPEKLSVGDVQTAIACPYRFFAKTSLQLLPAPEADDYDSARDYGLRLHRCLAALHTDMDGLPGPMERPWNEENREYALGIARKIVEAEFGPRARRHYSAAERRQKALAATRWYVEWLILLPAQDAQLEAEKPHEETFEADLTLRGRADCVITENDGVRILDHKSGGQHSQKSMRNGEDVQLTAYSLFYDNAKEISYMDMKKHRQVTLEGEDLERARSRLFERLQTFKHDAESKPLPAWADDAECRHCDYAGVCRRNAWHGTRS